MQRSLTQPFMFVWSEPPDANDPAWKQALAWSHAVLQHRSCYAYMLMLGGVRHSNFADYAVLFSPIVSLTGSLSSIDGQRGLLLTTMYVDTFFDTYLRHDDGSLLGAPTATYPEMHYLVP